MITTVPIPLASGKIGYVAAGPTKDLPPTHKLIRCAREIPIPASRVAFDVATTDFKPFDGHLIEENLAGILRAVEGGACLYAGCMGGTGRTGTILALMVGQHPSFSGAQAIDYIRAVYRTHAVETTEQVNQILTYSDEEPVMIIPDMYEAEIEHQAPPVFTSRRAEVARAKHKAPLILFNPQVGGQSMSEYSRPGYLKRIFGLG